MAARLKILGISMFAANASELLEITKAIPVSPIASQLVDPIIPFPVNESTDTGPTVVNEPTTPDRSDAKKSRSALDSGKSSRKPWHWVTAGAATAVVALIVVAAVVLLPGSMNEEPVAKALPVVPSLLLKPLVPLTVEELSGDTLPLKISGIKNRSVIEESAVAFWGDTAPDAFVTVNGDRIEVSEYGAFVVDFPLEDGANFIEILASDYQGRTTSASFVLVSTQ